MGGGLPHGHDLVHDVALDAAPGEGSVVFLVVEFDALAAAEHQRVGHGLAHDGEVELVGLQVAADRAAACALEARLDQAALIGLPDPSLVDDLVEFAGLDALAEDEVELEIHEYGGRHQQDGHGPGDDFAFG